MFEFLIHLFEIWASQFLLLTLIFLFLIGTLFALGMGFGYSVPSKAAWLVLFLLFEYIGIALLRLGGRELYYMDPYSFYERDVVVPFMMFFFTGAALSFGYPLGLLCGAGMKRKSKGLPRRELGA